jgi:hypothetical protein
MAMTMKRAVSTAIFAVMVASAAGLASCSGDDGGGQQTGPDASDNDGGIAGQSGAGGEGGIVGLTRVPATVTAYSTLGEPRTGDAVALSDDGFEYGERLCTANGLFCVTGGFGP